MTRNIIVYTALAVLVASLPLQAMATTVTEARDKQNNLRQQINTIKSEKTEVSQELINNREKRTEIVRELEEMGFQRKAIEERLVQIDSGIETLTEAIAQAEVEYAAELSLFQDRIVLLFQRSRSWQGLDFILNSQSISEFYKNRNAMKMISMADQAMMASLVQMRLDIEELRSQKQTELSITKDEFASMLQSIDRLQVSRAQVEDEINSTRKTLQQLEAEEDELISEASKISDYIRRLATANVMYVGGEMQWPAPGNFRIASAYGYRIHPIFRSRRFHSGIDITARQGEPISAANSGTVVFAGSRRGYGNTVIIDHGGGITTLYAHIMNRGILVREGQRVNVGDVIAKVGSTGWSTGPHLHFEVRRNGDHENPMPFLGTRQ